MVHYELRFLDIWVLAKMCRYNQYIYFTYLPSICIMHDYDYVAVMQPLHNHIYLNKKMLWYHY